MKQKRRATALKIKLLQKNLTQREVAEELGYSESYISMLINGTRTNEDFDSWVKKRLGLEI